MSRSALQGYYGEAFAGAGLSLDETACTAALPTLSVPEATAPTASALTDTALPTTLTAAPPIAAVVMTMAQPCIETAAIAAHVTVA